MLFLDGSKSFEVDGVPNTLHHRGNSAAFAVDGFSVDGTGLQASSILKAFYEKAGHSLMKAPAEFPALVPGYPLHVGCFPQREGLQELLAVLSLDKMGDGVAGKFERQLMESVLACVGGLEGAPSSETHELVYYAGVAGVGLGHPEQGGDKMDPIPNINWSCCQMPHFLLKPSNQQEMKELGVYAFAGHLPLTKEGMFLRVWPSLDMNNKSTMGGKMVFVSGGTLLLTPASLAVSAGFRTAHHACPYVRFMVYLVPKDSSAKAKAVIPKQPVHSWVETQDDITKDGYFESEQGILKRWCQLQEDGHPHRGDWEPPCQNPARVFSLNPPEQHPLKVKWSHEVFLDVEGEKVKGKRSVKKHGWESVFAY